MTKLTREELLKEATSLHDLILGEKHCDRKYLLSCAALQECIPQAAENLRKKINQNGS